MTIDIIYVLYYYRLDTAWNIASNIWPTISTMLPATQPEYTRGYNNQGYNYNSYNQQPNYYSPEKQYRYNNNNNNYNPPSSIYYTHSASPNTVSSHGYSSQIDHTYRNPLSYSTQQFSQSGKLQERYICFYLYIYK